jgi:hypothetical protein
MLEIQMVQDSKVGVKIYAWILIILSNKRLPLQGDFKLTCLLDDFFLFMWRPQSRWQHLVDEFRWRPLRDKYPLLQRVVCSCGELGASHI